MIKQIQYILILSLCLVNNALALIEIDITEGNREPLPIAISDFFMMK
jgi:Tol biopolymer transport system component